MLGVCSPRGGEESLRFGGLEMGSSGGRLLRASTTTHSRSMVEGFLDPSKCAGSDQLGLCRSGGGLHHHPRRRCRHHGLVPEEEQEEDLEGGAPHLKYRKVAVQVGRDSSLEGEEEEEIISGSGDSGEALVVSPSGQHRATTIDTGVDPQQQHWTPAAGPSSACFRQPQSAALHPPTEDPAVNQLLELVAHGFVFDVLSLESRKEMVRRIQLIEALFQATRRQEVAEYLRMLQDMYFCANRTLLGVERGGHFHPQEGRNGQPSGGQTPFPRRGHDPSAERVVVMTGRQHAGDLRRHAVSCSCTTPHLGFVDTPTTVPLTVENLEASGLRTVTRQDRWYSIQDWRRSVACEN